MQDIWKGCKWRNLFKVQPFRIKTFFGGSKKVVYRVYPKIVRQRLEEIVLMQKQKKILTWRHNQFPSFSLQLLASQQRREPTSRVADRHPSFYVFSNIWWSFYQFSAAQKKLQIFDSGHSLQFILFADLINLMHHIYATYFTDINDSITLLDNSTYT